MEFSVLMSVYYKENPEYLKLSLDSVIKQTVPATEIVLIKDGPLTKVWLSTEHLGGKYAKRVEAMMNYEKNR